MPAIILYLLLVFLKECKACIPTQNVDPFPCKTCSKVYDTTCEGDTGGYGRWCAKVEDVQVIYNLGTVPVGFLEDLGSNVCWNEMTCPFGTKAQYDIGGILVPGNDFGQKTYGYCSESGPNAGMWYVWKNDQHELPVMRCIGL